MKNGGKKVLNMLSITLISFAVILTGCNPASEKTAGSDTTGSAPRDTLVISSVREPDSIDVHKTWILTHLHKIIQV
ncbi:Uncharacterised protein [Cytobacillus firmus]|nr:Uncharacterised protein [Cytobacillus firmus]